jgi:hypothetical protein
MQWVPAGFSALCLRRAKPDEVILRYDYEQF